MRYLMQVSICLVVLVFFVSTSAYGKEKLTTRNIQIALTNAGYYDGLVSGQKSPKLTKAVRDFQTANRLKPDGIVGNKTWGILKRYLNISAPERNEKTDTDTPVALYSPGRTDDSRERQAATEKQYSKKTTRLDVGAIYHWTHIKFSKDVEGKISSLRISGYIGYFLHEWLEPAFSISYMRLTIDNMVSSVWAFPFSVVFVKKMSSDFDVAAAPFLGYMALDVAGISLDGIMLGAMAGVRYRLYGNWRLNAGVEYIYATIDNDNTGADVGVSLWMPDIGISYYF